MYTKEDQLLEQEYPDIHQLLQFTQSPFTFELTKPKETEKPTTSDESENSLLLINSNKYKRTRFLNNLASLKCREKRKEKSEIIKKRLEYLEVENLKLIKIISEKEALIQKLKKQLKNQANVINKIL